MDLYFNELSIKNKEELDYAVAENLVEVYKGLKENDINTCRIDTKDNQKLFSMIDKLPNSINIKNFYYSFFKLPFETEVVIRSEDKYYGHTWWYNGEKCFGLAISYLLHSICYSIFQSEWDKESIEIHKDDKEEKVRNISTRKHVDFHFTSLREKVIELVECGIHYSEKSIHLREDHGIDKLLIFAEKLVHCPYIIEVVNSLPYNPHMKKFIKGIKDNGLVEIVLPWTDQGLGLVVKTTGRTIEETRKIAQLIQEKYGYI